MASEKLNARRVETARCDDGKRLELRDEVARGLELRVMPSGSKTWSFNYTRASDGKRRRAKVGHFPALSLDEARTRAAELRRAVDDGEDPAHAAKVKREAATFEALADAWMRRYAEQNKAPKSLEDDRRMLAKDILPAIGAMKADQVSKKDVVRLLDLVADRGTTHMPNRVLELVRSIYNWGLGVDRCEVNPALGVKPLHKEKPRDRVLSDTEVTAFWAALDTAPMSKGSKIALRLLLLTGQRENNVAGMSRVELDLKAGVWTIPKARTKSKRSDHRVPLSPPALTLIQEALALADDSAWVFPSWSRKKKGGLVLAEVVRKPIDGHALSKAMRAMQKGGKLGMDHVRVHDLRRTAATGMGNLGFIDDVIKKVLDHAAVGVTGTTYNRSRYDDEKRVALNAWASKVEELAGLRAPVTNVLPMVRIPAA